MQKGPEYFVEAAAMVLKRTRNIRFVMAGERDPDERHDSSRPEEALPTFHFPGFMKGEQVYEVLKASDVYIMPSVSEPRYLASGSHAVQCADYPFQKQGSGLC